MPRTVSVIMPFVNEERFIGEAIESVVAPTYRDWELLLVDDGASAATRDVARTWAMRDPARLRLVRHADGGNHGPAASRNLGLDLATGAFVAFLDADDRYEPDKLETEIPILLAAPDVAMLYGPTRWWYPERERSDWTEMPGVRTNAVHRPPRLATEVLLRHRGQVPCTCAVLLRRSACRAVGGFEPAFRLYEDQTLWTKVFLRYPVFVSARSTTRYRQHDASVSARARNAGDYHRWRPHAAEARFLEWMRTHVDASGPHDRYLLRALDRAQAPYRRRSAAVARLGRDVARWVGARITDTLRRRAGA